MSIYKKLQDARIKLQNTQLQKTGHNKFAGYYYFELGDFLPTINQIFSDAGLCGIVSFSADTATLRVVDVDDEKEIVFTSPMGSAALKGCHEVQNIGAVETYQRRYLWVVAMEIVEHDAIDAMTSNEPQQKQKAPVATLSENQIANIETLAGDKKVPTAKICESAGVAKLSEIPSHKYESIIKKLNITKEVS